MRPSRTTLAAVASAMVCTTQGGRQGAMHGATLAAMLLGGTACKRRAVVEAVEIPSPEVSVAAGKPLSFEPARPGFGIALPRGCSERAPTLRAPIVGRSLYFAAAEEPGAGLLVVDRDPPAAHEALFAGGAQKAPLFDPAAPLFAHDGKAFRGFYVAGPPRARSAVLTREDHSALLATGDALTALDLRCRAGVCGALLPRVGSVAQAGFTLFLGEVARGPLSRFDVELPPAEHPVAIAGIADGGPAFVASAVGTDVRVHEVGVGAGRAHAPLALPFGVLDTAMLARPVAIGHGAAVVGACATPRPLGLLVREGLPALPFPVSAPLAAALIRPLGNGGVLGYSSALRCHDERQRFVSLVLLDGDGAPRGPAMLVAEGRGFALSTRGNDLDVVILREDEAVLARATCPP